MIAFFITHLVFALLIVAYLLYAGIVVTLETRDERPARAPSGVRLAR